MTSSGISVQSFGSGSSGNAFLVTSPQTRIIIDAGVGIRAMTTSLRGRGLSILDIDTICVTHEHSDHIRTLPSLTHRDTALFATSGTAIAAAMPRQHVERLQENRPVSIADITIWALPVSHDAREPSGFMLEFSDGTRVTLLTDLGMWQDSLADFVRASHLIVLEANHDVDMLRFGPYPIHLKRRVASDRGHLSNADCAGALGRVLSRTSHQPDIWLAHLSKENNRPEKAEMAVRTALREKAIESSVLALPRLAAGPIWTPRARLATTAFTHEVKLVSRQLGLGF